MASAPVPAVAGECSKNVETAPSWPADVAAPAAVRVLLDPALEPMSAHLRVDAVFAEGASARRRSRLKLPAGIDGTVLKPVASSPVPARVKTVTKSGNGFLAAIHTAYSLHKTLRLSPDDVWAPILSSVAAYVDKHAEEMRASFVTFKGKAKLCVVVPASFETMGDAAVPWGDVVHTFKEMIGEHTLGDVRTAFEPHFSTTDGISAAHAGVALMSAMNSFFEYSMMTLCGIREVVLEGTPEDWAALKVKTAALAALGGGRVGADLADWFAVLDKTLAQLEATARGAPSVDFWRHIYSSYTSGGSGASTCFSGWALNFFLYDSKGGRIPHALYQESMQAQLAAIKASKASHQAAGASSGSRSHAAAEMDYDWGYDADTRSLRGLHEDDVPTLVTSAPVTWKALDGATRELTFFSGSFGFGVTHSDEIMPVREWVIAETQRART